MARTARRETDDWTIDYTIGEDRDGATVITDVTVSPSDRDAIASGGITAATLRRVPTAARIAVRTWAEVRDSGMTYADLAKSGMTYADLATKVQIDANPQRGKQHDPRFLAQVARLYLDTVNSGSRDVIGDLRAKLRAQGLDYRRGGVRELISKARREKLLSPTVPGRAGGELTEKALELLDDEQ
jgi:hypothetical protein